jgi:transposase
MIGSTRHIRVFAYEAPVDMRRGFDGLHALVTQGLQRDVLAGDVFLFVSRTRKRAKALFWDGTGLCIYAKRLEQGRFAAPWGKDADGPMEMTMSELALFLEGSSLVGKVQLSPAPFVLASRVVAESDQRR